MARWLPTFALFLYCVFVCYRHPELPFHKPNFGFSFFSDSTVMSLPAGVCEFIEEYFFFFAVVCNIALLPLLLNKTEEKQKMKKIP